MASLVFLATPPRVPELGEGRTYAHECLDNSIILVLSPKIEPPLNEEEGSTAKTATLCPDSTSIMPNASIKVLETLKSSW
jgi:hypothetical protein